MRLAYFLLLPLSFVLIYVTVRLIYLEMDPFGMNEVWIIKKTSSESILLSIR